MSSLSVDPGPAFFFPYSEPASGGVLHTNVAVCAKHVREDLRAELTSTFKTRTPYTHHLLSLLVPLGTLGSPRVLPLQWGGRRTKMRGVPSGSSGARAG